MADIKLWDVRVANPDGESTILVAGFIVIPYLGDKIISWEGAALAQATAVSTYCEIRVRFL